MCLCSTFFDASFPNLYSAVEACKGKQDASVEVGVLRNQGKPAQNNKHSLYYDEINIIRIDKSLRGLLVFQLIPSSMR